VPDLPPHHKPDGAPAHLVVGHPDHGPRVVVRTTEHLVELGLLAPAPGPRPQGEGGPREPANPGAPRDEPPELVLVAGRDPHLGGLLAVQFWAGGSCLAGLEAAEDPEGHWTLRLHGLGAPG
jgi:hypothetical protein